MFFKLISTWREIRIFFYFCVFRRSIWNRREEIFGKRKKNRRIRNISWNIYKPKRKEKKRKNWKLFYIIDTTQLQHKTRRKEKFLILFFRCVEIFPLHFYTYIKDSRIECEYIWVLSWSTIIGIDCYRLSCFSFSIENVFLSISAQEKKSFIFYPHSLENFLRANSFYSILCVMMRKSEINFLMGSFFPLEKSWIRIFFSLRVIFTSLSERKIRQKIENLVALSKVFCVFFAVLTVLT